MAVRYSGQAEVRVRWNAERGVYVGVVRTPEVLWRGWVRAPEIGRAWVDSSSAYDHAAKKLIVQAEAFARKRGIRLDVDRDDRGQLQVSRTFESPCPSADTHPDRDRRRAPSRKRRTPCGVRRMHRR